MSLVSSLIWAGASGLDPTKLSLTAFLRDYAGGSWSGTASAGTSGSNAFADEGFAPSTGTALNGHGTADFIPANTDYLAAAGTLDTYINATAMSGWVLLNPDTTASGVIIGGDTTQTAVLYLASNVSLTVNTTKTVERAISSGTYSLVTWRYDGANLQIGVNEVPGAAGGASTTAYSTALSPRTEDFFLAADVGGGGYLDGLIAELAISDTVLSNATFTGVLAYARQRYGVTL